MDRGRSDRFPGRVGEPPDQDDETIVVRRELHHNFVIGFYDALVRRGDLVYSNERLEVAVEDLDPTLTSVLGEFACFGANSPGHCGMIQNSAPSNTAPTAKIGVRLAALPPSRVLLSELLLLVLGDDRRVEFQALDAGVDHEFLGPEIVEGVGL